MYALFRCVGKRRYEKKRKIYDNDPPVVAAGPHVSFAKINIDRGVNKKYELITKFDYLMK